MKRLLPSLMVLVPAMASFTLIAAPRALNRENEMQRAAGRWPVMNPHWTRDGCSACHEVRDDRPQTIPRSDIDRTCLRCHNGWDASREPHPIGRGFDGEHVVRPAGWPDVDGRLSCITCHDMIRACGADARRSGRNPAMLRGNAPDGAMRFCAACHVEPLHGRFNPHRMLSADGAVDRDSCRNCHRPVILDHSLEYRSGSAALLGDEITMCAACHRQHQDYFEPGHIGARPSSGVVAAMNHRYKNERHADLPLSPDGRIVCSTCHNPHPAGVFHRASPLAAGGMQSGATRGAHAALRVDGSGICLACHWE